MSELATYSAQFERYANALTAAERAPRSVQFSRFLDSGFPHKDLEDWRYSDLSALNERDYEPDAIAADTALPELLLGNADALIYVNGRVHPASAAAARWHSDTCELPPPASGVDALNAAFASGGLRLRIDRGSQLDRPLQVLFVSRSDAQATMSHQRHLIELGDEAVATVLLDFSGDGGERLATHFFDVRLGRGAKLCLYRIQNEGSGGTLITRVDAKLSRDAKLDAVTIDLGAGFIRHEGEGMRAVGESGQKVRHGRSFKVRPGHLDLFDGVLFHHQQAVRDGTGVDVFHADLPILRDRVGGIALGVTVEIHAVVGRIECGPLSRLV